MVEGLEEDGFLALAIFEGTSTGKPRYSNVNGAGILYCYNEVIAIAN